MPRHASLLGLLAIVLAFAGGAGAHETKTETLEIVHPWTVEKSSGDVVKVALTIKNIGRRADRLVGAATPLAQSVTLIERGPNDAAEGRPVAAIAVKAGERIELAMSGTHLRLTGFARALSPYDSFTLTLEFARAGKIEVEVLVEEDLATK